MKNLFVVIAASIIFFQSTSFGNFKVDVGAIAGLGTMGNESGSVASRDMNFLEIYATPFYMMSGFYGGPRFGYQLQGQTTDTASVSGTNLGGSGYLLGLFVGYRDAKYKGGIGYDFFGEYTQTKTTASNATSKFTTPAGISLSFGYFLSPQLSIDLLYSDLKYSKSNVNGAEADLSSNKIKSIRYGVGATYSY